MRHLAAASVVTCIISLCPRLAAAAKVAPCAGGRFLPDAALVSGDAPPATDAIVINDGSRLSIGSSCGPARVKLKGSAQGTVAKSALRCNGVRGKVKLKARFDTDCGRLSGTLKIARQKKAFSARRSTGCGDGLVDPGLGEQCEESGDCPAGETCSACGCVSAPTTSTIGSSTTTTTSAAATSTTTATAPPTTTTMSPATTTSTVTTASTTTTTAPPGSPELSIDDVSVTEDDAGTGTLTFTITQSAPSANVTTVSYATADGSATIPEDYAAVSGTAEIAPGATTTEVIVPIHGDTVVEEDETLLVNLSNPVNAVIGTAGQAVGVILDDDASGPTTFELIDQALGDGLIDEETALVYKVYDSFGDGRLPQAYRGRDDRFIDNPVIDEVRARFDTLSPQTQALLAPFLLPADEPGSWMDLQQSATVNTTVTLAAGAHRGEPTPAAVSASAVWTRVDTANGQASVWWRSDRSSDAARAQAFAAELDRYLWAKLTTAFKTPRPDVTALNPGGPADYHAGDPRLDILLTSGQRASTEILAGCDGNPRGALIELTPFSDNAELAHELMHAIIAAYPTLTCQGRGDLRWMNEATATWAQQFTYPSYNSEHGNRTHRGAKDYLDSPEVPLNFLDNAHEYGAYLWFFHLAGQGNDPTVVKKTWEAAYDKASLDAVESTLQSLGFGGFDGQWPKFVLNNWNRVAADNAPYRKYFAWDRLRHQAAQAEFTLSLQGGWVVIPIAYVLPRLTATYRYYDFTTDPDIRGVLFENLGAGDTPTASIQAIIKVKDQPWRTAEDWSGSDGKKKFFCRDKAEEDVEKIAIVIANRGFHAADPDVEDKGKFNLYYSALPCRDWTGSTTYHRTGTSTGSITSADGEGLRFQPDLTGPGGFWRAIEGTVTVHRDETFPFEDGSCTSTGSKSLAANGHGHFALLWLGGNVLQFSGEEDPFDPEFTIAVKTECSSSNGSVTIMQDEEWFFADWFNTGPTLRPVAFGATTLTGNYSAVDGGDDVQWTWDFMKEQEQ